MINIPDEKLDGLSLVFLSYGYEVTKDDLKGFLEGKQINDNEKIRLAKRALEEYDLIYQEEQKKKAIEAANKPDKVQTVKKYLEDKLKEYGYDISKEEFELGFSRISKEIIYKLYNAIDWGDFTEYRFDELFLEEFFSLVDFFGLKEKKLYDEILKQSGTIYFRINKKQKNLNLNDKNNKRYTYLYEIVDYNGNKYVIRRLHGNSMIVNIPEDIMKEEFKSFNEYLTTFERVGKLGYKSGEYDKDSSAKFYISYKNEDMVIAKIGYPGRIFLSSIFPGKVYTDDNWEYVEPKNKKYTDISLKDAVDEIIYGKKPSN